MYGARMNFGMYNGRLLEDVPDSYLKWCLTGCGCLTWDLRRAIKAELERRFASTRAKSERVRSDPPRAALPNLAGVIRTWHRELVLRHHPDRGGDTKVMQALNSAHDRLKQLLGFS